MNTVRCVAQPLPPSNGPEVSNAHPWQFATVVATTPPHSAVVELNSLQVTAFLAAHLGSVVPGQNVLLVMLPGVAPLIVAAYPLAASNSDAPENSTAALSFDSSTGTLRIEASRLQLTGLAGVELRCGDAVLRLTAQGELLTQAQSITQAAIGAHRLEGASIDLN